jgi:hypothetical protein
VLHPRSTGWERVREIKRVGEEYPRSRYEPIGLLERLVGSSVAQAISDGQRSGLIEERLGEFVEAFSEGVRLHLFPSAVDAMIAAFRKRLQRDALPPEIVRLQRG